MTSKPMHSVINLIRKEYDLRIVFDVMKPVFFLKHRQSLINTSTSMSK